MCVGKYRKKSTGYKRSSVINDYHIQYVVGCFNIDAKGLLCTRTRVLTHTNVQLLLVCVCLFFHTHLYISCVFSAAKKSVTICGWLAFIALKKKRTGGNECLHASHIQT